MTAPAMPPSSNDRPEPTGQQIAEALAGFLAVLDETFPAHRGDGWRP